MFAMVFAAPERVAHIDHTEFVVKVPAEVEVASQFQLGAAYTTAAYWVALASSHSMKLPFASLKSP